MTDASSPETRSDPPHPQVGLLDRLLIVAGLVFSAASALALGYGIYLLYKTGVRHQADRDPTIPLIIALHIDIIIMVLFAAIAAFISLRFFGRASRSTSYVIRPEDRSHIWPLIEKAEVASIDQYIRLASLSGFSGAFTKVGFTGLPLATVALTLIFVVLSILFNKQDLMELAKLTLGAFIGSFVQRQVERAGRTDAAGDQQGAPPPRLPV